MESSEPFGCTKNFYTEPVIGFRRLMQSPSGLGREGPPTRCGQGLIGLIGQSEPDAIEGDGGLEDVDVLCRHKALSQQTESDALTVGHHIQDNDGVTG